jgi:hypothetical protein
MFHLMRERDGGFSVAHKYDIWYGESSGMMGHFL